MMHESLRDGGTLGSSSQTLLFPNMRPRFRLIALLHLLRSCFMLPTVTLISSCIVRHKQLGMMVVVLWFRSVLLSLPTGLILFSRPPLFFSFFFKRIDTSLASHWWQSVTRAGCGQLVHLYLESF